MTWCDRIALLRIFLAWLFGSIFIAWTVDKLGACIKKRRQRSAKRKAAKKITTN